MFSRRSLLSLFALLVLFGIVAFARPLPEATSDSEKRQQDLVTAIVAARATVVAIVANITSAYQAGDVITVVSYLQQLVVTIDGVTTLIGSTQIAAGSVIVVAASLGAILTSLAPTLILVGSLGPTVVVAVAGVVTSVNGLLIGIGAVVYGVGPIVTAAIAEILVQLQINIGVLVA